MNYIGSLLLAEGDSVVPQLTAGLGVIAAALVIGQYLVYKFIVSPERERAATALAEEITRSTKSLSDEVIRSEKSLVEERARSQRLEDEIRRQNEVLQEKALPALINATGVVGESQALLRELRRDQEIAKAVAERASEFKKMDSEKEKQWNANPTTPND